MGVSVSVSFERVNLISVKEVVSSNPDMSSVTSPRISSMRSKGGYWRRPTSRTYMYNLDVGEHYYQPMTSYLESERGTRGETPGALTFDERLSRNWLSGRRYEATEAREGYARSSSLARESNSKGFDPSALRSARAASEVAESATARQAQAASATASRSNLVASSMSASRQQASSQQTDEELKRAAAKSRARIQELERAMDQIKVLETVFEKARQVTALNTIPNSEINRGACLINWG